MNKINDFYDFVAKVQSNEIEIVNENMNSNINNVSSYPIELKDDLITELIEKPSKPSKSRYGK